MAKATACALIAALIFNVIWVWHFLGSPASPDSFLAALIDPETYPVQFWLIALFVFVAVFMTVKNT